MALPEPRNLEQVVRDGLSTLVFGFGYRVGIVDGFIKIKQPCTAEELAQKINMKKRYIEEWLSCLAAAGIVRVHENDRFSLPYDESVLTTQGHLASILPIFCESIPKLEKVICADGPRGYTFTASFLKFVEGWSTPVAIENWVKTSLEPVLNLNGGD
uniref:S-adenosylmethionine-dependent methyltransferase Rv2258c-like winged HTH domain-containing protein n=1 Tax=Magallana gigas TaxID=29159 RepID=A0A8W8JHA2_MAGGI|nr:uncharacterized protein LOC105341543 [Crassostrea gigas]